MTLPGRQRSSRFNRGVNCGQRGSPFQPWPVYFTRNNGTTDDLQLRSSGWKKLTTSLELLHCRMVSDMTALSNVPLLCYRSCDRFANSSVSAWAARRSKRCIDWCWSHWQAKLRMQCGGAVCSIGRTTSCLSSWRGNSYRNNFRQKMGIGALDADPVSGLCNVGRERRGVHIYWGGRTEGEPPATY